LRAETAGQDTNQLICSQRPVYGDGTEASFHESGYINIPPCVFGSAAEGLLPPPSANGLRGLPLDTPLFSRKVTD
jgi:hypothetical protein